MNIYKLSNEQLIDYIIDGHNTDEPRKELVMRLNRGDKAKQFLDLVSCLYSEGVEFMTKTEIYEAIKKCVKNF
jgi:hypothetical protein